MNNYGMKRLERVRKLYKRGIYTSKDVYLEYTRANLFDSNGRFNSELYEE